MVALAEHLIDGGHCEKEGLFRIPGSSSRQRMVRNAMEGSENAWQKLLNEDVTPWDVASLIKQWLRELPEPIIPLTLQQTLVE